MCCDLMGHDPRGTVFCITLVKGIDLSNNLREINRSRTIHPAFRATGPQRGMLRRGRFRRMRKFLISVKTATLTNSGTVFWIPVTFTGRHRNLLEYSAGG